MATSSVLYACAKQIGATCESVNRAFIECKAADEEPSACLDKGEAVQACALGVLKSAMETCQNSFQEYANCLDRQISEEYMFDRCRKEEHSFRDCRAAANNSSVVAPAVSERKETNKQC